MNENLKIIGLQLENLRKIKAFAMEFASNGLIQIRGKNFQGKTTILDGIEILLRGKKHTPKDVISHGQKEARMISQLGKYKIQRVINQKGDHKIKISKDGKQVTTSPQSFLDDLINELTFNPKPFIDKSSADKLKFMMELLNLDFTDIDEELKEKESERTLVGREVKAFGELPILAKVEQVDVNDLMKQKEAATKKNNDIERGKEKSKDLYDDIVNQTSKISELEKQLLSEKNHLGKIEENKKIVDQALAKLGDPVDTTELDERIQSVSKTNQMALEYSENEKKKEAKADKETEYENLTAKIQELRAEKEQIFKSAPMPIEGLQVREDGVYFNDIHSENWSDSESMKISFDLCVAMKPELKAVFIDRGESFDQTQLKLMDEWAKKNDIQAFITIVDSGEVGEVENAIYIEEGEIIS